MKGQDQIGLIDFYFYVYLKRKKLNLKDICLIRAQPPPSIPYIQVLPRHRQACVPDTAMQKGDFPDGQRL